MLNKDPEKRATLEQVLQHHWVTQDGKEMVDINQVSDITKNEDGFGNINRVLHCKALGQGKTFKELFNKDKKLDCKQLPMEVITDNAQSECASVATI